MRGKAREHAGAITRSSENGLRPAVAVRPVMLGPYTAPPGTRNSGGLAASYRKVPDTDWPANAAFSTAVLPNGERPVENV